jgi:hypothetical protein
MQFPNLLSLFRRTVADEQAQHEDGIVQGFGQVGVPTSEAPVKGRARGEAVAAHLRIQSRELAEGYCHAEGLDKVQTALQAGAAATEAMADVLDAVMARDAAFLRRALESFVNGAIDTGAVALQ